jgi:hypothetical protein
MTRKRKQLNGRRALLALFAVVALSVGAPAGTTRDAAAATPTYTLGQQVFASYSCDDRNGSGMNGCKGNVADGAPVNTSTFGARFSFTK